MKNLIIRVCTLIIWIACSAASAEPQIQLENKFISIADIHFDPFADCKTSLKSCKVINELCAANYQDWDKIFSKYDSGVVATTGHDTNYHLFKLTLTELRKIKDKENPEFGLILGDFLAHEFKQKYLLYSHDLSKTGYQAFVRKTLQYMTMQFHQVFSDIDMYPVIGNNDSYTGDYSVQPQGNFLQDTANTWSMLIADKKNQRALLQTFPSAGYYSVTLADKTHRIILLDTVLFSTHAKKSNATAAQQELTWLQTQLSAAAQQKQKVLLAFHIPVGVDVYATLKNKFGSISEFWQEKYAGQFSDELKNYSSIVKVILPAHIHMDTFQLISVNKIANIPVIFTPSISPIFGNNPGFKIFHYDPETFEIENYDTYYLPAAEKNQWEKEYTFNQMYQPNCDSCKVMSGMQNLTRQSKLAEYFKQFYAVGNKVKTIMIDWIPYYWCDFRMITSSEYQRCVKTCRG